MNKIKFHSAAVLLLFCSLSTQIFAQTVSNSLSMTLEECLEYAKDNSITLQKAKLQIEDSKSDQLTAKGAMLPTISGSISQDASTTPLRTNSDMSSSSYNGSYGLDLSLTLYKGGKNRAVLQQSVINSDIAELEYGEYYNSIEVAITEVYVEILYTIERIKVDQNSLDVAIKTQERGKTLLEVGSINQVDYAQLESATASYRYNLIESETSLKNLYVELKHILEISQETDLSIKEYEVISDPANIPIPSVNEVYSEALSYRPEIQLSKLSIETAKLNETVAKSGYLPTLMLTAGTGVSHSTSSSYTFTTQLNNNFNSSVGLRLSIPIFSNYYNKTAVAKAKNSTKTATLSLTEAQKELYQTIESLYNNATTAQARYNVSKVQLDATKKSLDLVNEQYEVKMKTTLELLTQQDNYNQSYQDYLTNKYQLLYNQALLRYYKTDIIKL